MPINEHDGYISIPTQVSSDGEQSEARCWESSKTEQASCVLPAMPEQKVKMR